MHLAREYTEHWMHHQHIFETVGIESLKSRRLMLPLLTTFAHSLQRAYHDVPAPQDTLVLLRFTGEAASEFHLIREADRWRLVASSDRSPAATITMTDDTAWRLFTKGISLEAARSQSMIEGDQELGQHVFNAVAILA